MAVDLQSFAVGVDVILNFFDTLRALVIVNVAGLAICINDPYACAILKDSQVLLGVCAIGLSSGCNSLLLSGFVSSFLFCNLGFFRVGFAFRDGFWRGNVARILGNLGIVIRAQGLLLRVRRGRLVGIMYPAVGIHPFGDCGKSTRAGQQQQK
jgi:hypothetical protein